jgi:hypothetical protein
LEDFPRKDGVELSLCPSSVCQKNADSKEVCICGILLSPFLYSHVGCLPPSRKTRRTIRDKSSY